MGTNCKLEPIDGGKVRCAVCGREFVIPPGLTIAKMHPRCKADERRPMPGGSGVQIDHTAMSESRKKEIDEGAEALGLRASDVVHWGGAILRWNKAGRPTRTQEEVDAIVAICQANTCGKFTTEWGGRCKLCGCRVNQSTIPVINKAKLGTEHCPLNPPLW